MKYRFEILHMSKFLKQVCELMKKMDLAMDGIAVKDVMTFTSRKDVSILEIKMKITEAYESLEHTVLHIEGGKVE